MSTFAKQTSLPGRILLTSLLLVEMMVTMVTVGPGFGQSKKKPEKDDTIRLESDLVTLDAIVTDKDGNYVRDLKAEDFAVYEDGALRKLDFFGSDEKAELTRPLAAVFALDISGSIQPEEIIKQRDAAESFVRLVRPESVFAVLAFNYQIRVLQDFTSDPSKISQSFRKIGPAEGSTKIFQSIDRAVSMLKRGPMWRGGRRLRRVVIVITDGYDSVDPIDQTDLIRRANDAAVTVYSITLPSYMPGLGQKQRALTLLDASHIVPATGGADFSADSGDFTQAFRAIAEEIKASYTLAYYPPDNDRHDGRTHQIRVELRKPGLLLKTSRQSYVAQK